MLKKIRTKINSYQSKILHALDKKDANAAIQYRAIQKALEDLLEEMQSENAIDVISDYTPVQVCDMLGIDRSTLSRNRFKWEGYKLGGRYFYPKEVIDNEYINRQGKKKPGRKSLKGGD